MTAGRWRSIAVSAFVIALTGACGVPTGDDTFAVIPPEEDPFGLDATSTTTSTSTTTTTTLPVTPDTIATSTTVVRLEPAEFYFLTTRSRLQPIVVDLPPPFSAEQIADILEAGPPPDVALTSLIRPGLIVSSSESRGVLTVDLDPNTFAVFRVRSRPRRSVRS